jgi:hypothetical protein
MADTVGPTGRPPGLEPSSRQRVTVEAPPREPATPRRYREAFKEQLGLRGIMSEYLIPAETNTIWYVLGGVLAIALVLEVLSGMILALRYTPDAGGAYGLAAGRLEASRR